ncbi:MAG: T9SS type A sorting domain-containing protein [Rhodothermales bacterium]|nr:T9SS type A sorting domain-containing protein [Rhodothermales bacterium]
MKSVLSFTLAALLSLFLVSRPFLAETRLPPARTGNFYVSSFAGDKVTVFDSTGVYLRDIIQDHLAGPRGVVFGPNDRLYVASQNNDQILVFGSDEAYITSFAHAELDGPTGMAISPAGELYVGSYNNDQVVVFDLDGAFLRSFTGGGLNGTNCVAFDTHGNSYVSSALTNEVVKFSPSDAFVKTFTGGGLLSPMSIARDISDLLYVSGGSSNNVAVFDTTGRFIAAITHHMDTPQGIAFDDLNHMYVTSFSQNVVQQYAQDRKHERDITAGGLQVPRSIAFRPLPTATSTEKAERLLDGFALHPSFPNPFREETVVRYTVPAGDATVSIEVFDLQGRRVATLFNGRQPAGSHQAEWDGWDAGGRRSSAGIYVVRLRTGPAVISRKIVRL